MAKNIVGMIAAVFGYLPLVWGAVGPELIDQFAVLNAARVALPASELQDFCATAAERLRKRLPA